MVLTKLLGRNFIISRSDAYVGVFSFTGRKWPAWLKQLKTFNTVNVVIQFSLDGTSKCPKMRTYQSFVFVFLHNQKKYTASKTHVCEERLGFVISSSGP